MNKLKLVIGCLFCITKLYSQEAITEANYLKNDSLLWTDFEKKQEELSQYWETMPDKRDSAYRLSLMSY